MDISFVAEARSQIGGYWKVDETIAPADATEKSSRYLEEERGCFCDGKCMISSSTLCGDMVGRIEMRVADKSWKPVSTGLERDDCCKED